MFLSVALLQAGFFDHDKEYYDKHPQEAKEKNELCEKAVVTALKNGDMKLAEKYSKDEECTASRKSYSEYRAKIRKAKYEAEKKKRKEELAKKKAAFESEYKKYYDSYKKADFEAYNKDRQECIRHMVWTSSYRLEDAKCKAWKDLKKEKEQARIDTIIKENPEDKLIEYQKSSCNKYGYKCDLANRALYKEKEERAKYYLAHKDILKRDFNDCYNKIDSLNKKSKYKESQKVKNSYKCMTAAKAAQKLKIYGYYKPMK